MFTVATTEGVTENALSHLHSTVKLFLASSNNTSPDSSSFFTTAFQPQHNISESNDKNDDDNDHANKSYDDLKVTGKKLKIYHRLSANMCKDMEKIEEVVGNFKKLNPDGTECACLKAIALFKPGNFC